MTWSLAFPNLLVGLREGLEAGLVVTILIGAVRRLAPDRPLSAVWAGVSAATVLSLSFGAVLTFGEAELPPKAQEVFGGVTSLLAVVLVTSMIFWMRRAARGLSSELRSRVDTALAAGGTALAITAFFAVAREGLEAALFVWTNAQAAGSTTSPLLGALLGLLIACALCAGLYRRVLKINLTRFFKVTGTLLVVVVAGVLAYGLTDLQDAGLLPGGDAVAFDLTAHVPAGTWWTELLRGTTNLTPRMTWLPVVAYLAYLAIALTVFLRPTAAPAQTTPSKPPASTSPTLPAASPTSTEAAATPTAAGRSGAADSLPTRAVAALTGRRRPAPLATTRRPSRRSTALVGGLLVPVAAAAVWVAVSPDSPGSGSSANTVTIADDRCAADWAPPTAGTTVYSVRNDSTRAVDVEIVTAQDSRVVAEIEVLGPGTARNLPVTLTASAYAWKCAYNGAPTVLSEARTAIADSAAGTQNNAAAPLVRATTAEMQPALTAYRTYVAGQLTTLVGQVAALSAAAATGDRAATQSAWLAAYLTYHRLGAAYNAFGDAGQAVDGLASGLPGGTSDPQFVGFHRIEHDLWAAQPMTDIVRESAALGVAVGTLQQQLPSFTLEPHDVTVRAHEIIEDTVRFVLTGQSDYGSGTGFAVAAADLAGDRVVVDMLAPLLNSRSATLTGDITARMNTLQAALDVAIASGTSIETAPRTLRQRVNAATGDLAEALAPIPDLLEIRTP